MGMLDTKSSLLDSAHKNADPSHQLQTLVLKQMLMSSGMFKGSDAAGSSIHAEMFADALAEAVVNSSNNPLAQLSAQGTTAPTPSATTGALSALPPTAAANTASDGASIINDAILAGAGHLTSNFGLRSDPLDGHLASHAGVDVGAKEGSDILAAAAGVVKKAGVRGGYGEALEVDHGNGVTTLYGHASQLLVKEGDHVAKGQTIAKVGHTGRATGDHLHFEVRVAGKAVDPSRALKAYGGALAK